MIMSRHGNRIGNFRLWLLSRERKWSAHSSVDRGRLTWAMATGCADGVADIARSRMAFTMEGAAIVPFARQRQGAISPPNSSFLLLTIVSHINWQK